MYLNRVILGVIKRVSRLHYSAQNSGGCETRDEQTNPYGAPSELDKGSNASYKEMHEYLTVQVGIWSIYQNYVVDDSRVPASVWARTVFLYLDCMPVIRCVSRISQSQVKRCSNFIIWFEYSCQWYHISHLGPCENCSSLHLACILLYGIESINICAKVWHLALRVSPSACRSLRLLFTDKTRPFSNGKACTPNCAITECSTATAFSELDLFKL